MCMMLTQSIGCENFPPRRVAQIAQIMIPSDASLSDLAASTRRPALASLSNSELQTSHAIRLGAVGPKSRILHRRWARRLRLRPSQHQSQRDAKGRRQIGRDGAWVRRDQSRGSWDPPAHFREAPTRRYSGYQQPFPSRAGSPNAHAMLLGRKSPTAVPHWKGRST